MRDFPESFLWGSSTAAHQVDGGNTNNDWWAWEHAEGTPAVEPSGDAIQHRSRYEEDFALLALLGHTAHRISLEWSRIEPADGVIDDDEIAHYRRVLSSLVRHGITPFVTLHHFTLPRWFAERGGWAAPDALDRFARYVAVVSEHLGDLIAYACTINEPQIVAFRGYVTGQFPPGVRDRGLAVEVNAVLIAAHRVAVAALRAGRGEPLVGTCLQLVPLEPLRPDDPDDVHATQFLRRLIVQSHIDDLRAGGDVGDFVGLQYYTRVRIDARADTLLADVPAGVPTTQMGWELHPEGLGDMLRRLAEVGLPIIVTENGIATDDDRERIAYVAAHLAELKRALDDVIDARGYLYWSAFDNFEWNHGYAPTFGLIGIDRADGLRRFVRPSALAFAELARTGRLDALTPAGGLVQPV